MDGRHPGRSFRDHHAERGFVEARQVQPADALPDQERRLHPPNGEGGRAERRPRHRPVAGHDRILRSERGPGRPDALRPELGDKEERHSARENTGRGVFRPGLPRQGHPERAVHQRR